MPALKEFQFSWRTTYIIKLCALSSMCWTLELTGLWSLLCARPCAVCFPWIIYFTFSAPHKVSHIIIFILQMKILRMNDLSKVTELRIYRLGYETQTNVTPQPKLGLHPSNPAPSTYPNPPRPLATVKILQRIRAKSLLLSSLLFSSLRIHSQLLLIFHIKQANKNRALRVGAS